ncbi:MAG: phosphatidylglycerol lysyltransferase domain-containing protein [Candidatus Omnitrophota bacterium]
MNLSQLVPSDFCLKCRGCCIFSGDALAPAEPDDAWCARLMVEEEIALEKRVPGVSFGGRLLTVPFSGGRHACRCLDPQSHHCRIYDARPFECAVYPFLLSAENGRLRLYVHSACPYVREKRRSPEWEPYVAALKAFFLLPDNSSLLKAANASYPDYSVFKDEVEFVSDIPFIDGAAALLARKPELDGWFARRRAPLSSRSLVSLVAWSDLFDFHIEEADGNGLVYARQGAAEFLYCPPLGASISAQAVEEVFRHMKNNAARIEGVSQGELAAFDNTRYRDHVQGEEYYYERARLASLAGNDYRSKRSDINAFVRKHQPVFRAFRPQDTAACHDLFDRWLDKRRASYEDGIYRAMLVENRPVHRRMIASAAELGLIGRVVEVAGRPAGYTFGYELNADTFCVALEVTAPEFKGLPSFIFREFCADAELASFKYINAMDDFGMPGVARAKRSWRPAFLEKVYAICLKP